MQTGAALAEGLSTPPRLCGVCGVRTRAHLAGGFPLLSAGHRPEPTLGVWAWWSPRLLRLFLLPAAQAVPFGAPSPASTSAWLHCELLPSSGQTVNLCRLDAKLKFKHTQQLEGSLDSRHGIQMEEASPEGLRFSPVFPGKSNSLHSLLGPQSQPGDQLHHSPAHLCCPRVRVRGRAVGSR